MTVAFDSQPQQYLSEEIQARAIIETLPDPSEVLTEAGTNHHDLVLVDYPSSRSRDTLTNLAKYRDWMIGVTRQFSETPNGCLQLGEYFALYKAAAYANTTASESHDLTILSQQANQRLHEALSTSSCNRVFCHKLIQHFSLERDARIVIDDSAGTLFDAMCSDVDVFTAMQKILTSGVRTLWLTRGVKQGQKPAAAMAEGLLRTTRSGLVLCTSTLTTSRNLKMWARQFPAN